MKRMQGRAARFRAGTGGAIGALVILGCAGAWLGQRLFLGYWERALLKSISFAGCMGLYLFVSGDRDALAIFRRPDRQSLKWAASLALGVFLFLAVGYTVVSPWLDLSAIPDQLRSNGITAENFPAVSAYIILCNALLEEVFFRGLAFLILKRHTGARFACIFSGLVFAGYHVSILSGWFQPLWFVLFIAGLAVAGMLFNFFDRRGSIWNGYLIHAGANLAINLIGMRMFGIL